MRYTIKQAGEKVNLSSHTLRYYDKEGLLPFLERDGAGHRSFTDQDIEWLKLICCLKNTGMSLKQIKKYIELCMQGKKTLDIRRKILVEHRKNVTLQIDELNQNLERIDHKIDHYNSTCTIEHESIKISSTIHE